MAWGTYQDRVSKYQSKTIKEIKMYLGYSNRDTVAIWCRYVKE